MKIIKLIKRNLKVIAILSVMIVVVGFGIIKYFLVQNEDDLDVVMPLLEEKEEKDEEFQDNEKEEEVIFVDIKGEVLQPGVYAVENSDKVIDVIQLAGGFTEQADTSLINLAKRVTSEMFIIIYSKEEVKKALEGDEIIKFVDNPCVCPEVKNDACLNNKGEDTNKKDDENVGNKLVNLNTATLEELQTLSGIGESKAKAIIEYREKVGGFSRIEELMEVTGIGEALYEKIKANITV